MTAAESVAQAPRLSDAQLFALADEYEEARGRERSAKQCADDCAAQIIGELDRRGLARLAGLESTVSVVRPAIYDVERLYGGVRESLREELFTAELDFARLDPAELRALLAYLGPTQRDQVTVHKVRDPAALRHAVDSGRIAQRTAKRCTTYGKPSIRVTRGPGTRRTP